MEAALMLDTEIARVFDAIEIKGLAIGFTRPKIATMTMTFQLDKTTVSLNEVEMMCESFVRTNDTPRPNKKKRPYKRFNNSITLVFDKKAMKVFVNGKLHVTGCGSVAEAKAIVDLFLEAMMWDFDGVNVKNVEVHTFNTCIRTPNTPKIDLNEVNFKFGRVPGVVTGYDPLTYHGLKIMKPITDENGVHNAKALLFNTGTMTIAGVKIPKDVETMFDLVSRVIKS